MRIFKVRYRTIGPNRGPTPVFLQRLPQGSGLKVVSRLKSTL